MDNFIQDLLFDTKAMIEHRENERAFKIKRIKEKATVLSELKSETHQAVSAMLRDIEMNNEHLRDIDSELQMLNSYKWSIETELGKA